MSAMLDGVGYRNGDQLSANFYLAMNGLMAWGAKRNQIVGIVVRLVLINVMHMQKVSPSLALFVAKLACPFITVFDLLAKAFPVGRISPLSNAAFPGGVIGAGNGAAQKQGLGNRTRLDSVLLHFYDNGSARNTELRGDLIERSTLVDVFGTQPIRIVIELFGVTMAANILAGPTWVFGRGQELAAPASTVGRKLKFKLKWSKLGHVISSSVASVRAGGDSQSLPGVSIGFTGVIVPQKDMFLKAQGAR